MKFAAIAMAATIFLTGLLFSMNSMSAEKVQSVEALGPFRKNRGFWAAQKQAVLIPDEDVKATVTAYINAMGWSNDGSSDCDLVDDLVLQEGVYWGFDLRDYQMGSKIGGAREVCEQCTFPRTSVAQNWVIVNNHAFVEVAMSFPKVGNCTALNPTVKYMEEVQLVGNSYKVVMDVAIWESNEQLTSIEEWVRCWFTQE